MVAAATLRQRIIDCRSELYDYFYDVASEVLARDNPCKITKGTCAGRSLLRVNAEPGVLCCEDCRHHTPSGCSVRSLGCRLWLCSAVWNSSIGPDLRRIRTSADRAKIPRDSRASKKENFARWPARAGGEG